MVIQKLHCIAVTIGSGIFNPGYRGGGFVKVSDWTSYNRPLAILQKSLDRALFLHIFIHEIRSSGVRASITIVHIRKFYKM